MVWQLYEAELEDLPPWCSVGRVVSTATVPLVCFHLVEKYTPDRVVRQFGMIQEIPRNVDIVTMLHAIDLRGKVGVDWMRKHVVYIMEWGNCLQRRCESVLGDMPPQHKYFDWFRRVTRRFIDVPDARLILMVTSLCLLHLTVLLSMKPLFREHDICGPMSALASNLPFKAVVCLRFLMENFVDLKI